MNRIVGILVIVLVLYGLILASDKTARTLQNHQRIAERLKQYGHDIQFSDLVYHGERSHVIEYLTALGWQVSAQKITEAYTANGFTYRLDPVTGAEVWANPLRGWGLGPTALATSTAASAPVPPRRKAAAGPAQ